MTDIIMPFEGLNVNFLLYDGDFYISLKELSSVVEIKPKHVKQAISRSISKYDEYVFIKKNDELIKGDNCDQSIDLMNSSSSNEILLDELGYYYYVMRSRTPRGERFAKSASKFMKATRMRLTQSLTIGNQDIQSYRPDFKLMKGLLDTMIYHDQKINSMEISIDVNDYENNNRIDRIEEELQSIKKSIENNPVSLEQAQIIKSKVNDLAELIHQSTGSPKRKIYPGIYDTIQNIGHAPKYDKVQQKYYNDVLTYLEKRIQEYS